VKIVVLQQLDMVEAGFHHRIGARLAVLVQQVFFQAAGVHPDADRTAVVLGRPHHLGHALGVTDVAGVDPQAGSPRLGRLDRAFVVEMDVGDDRNRAFRHDLAQGAGAFLSGVDTRTISAPATAQRWICSMVAATSVVSVLVIVCTEIGASPPTSTLPTLICRETAPVDVAPGTDGVVRHRRPRELAGARS
jgi:hypothetical protein